MAGRRTARLRRLIMATVVPLGLAACAAPGTLTPAEAGLHGPLVPAPQDLFKFVAFSNSPFPFHGTAPGAAKPFMDVSDNGRLGHSSFRNGVLWEDQTYSDRRSLLYIPRGFDPRRPALMVVFLHGNEATLERDVLDRQGVARQFLKSGLNAVLVAPQLAFDARDFERRSVLAAGLLSRLPARSRCPHCRTLWDAGDRADHRPSAGGAGRL